MSQSPDAVANFGWSGEELNGQAVEFRLALGGDSTPAVVNGIGIFAVEAAPDGLRVQIRGTRSGSSELFSLNQAQVELIKRHPQPARAEFMLLQPVG